MRYITRKLVIKKVLVHFERKCHDRRISNHHRILGDQPFSDVFERRISLPEYDGDVPVSQPEYQCADVGRPEVDPHALKGVLNRHPEKNHRYKGSHNGGADHDEWQVIESYPWIDFVFRKFQQMIYS
jgi:hypothetical protein